MKSDSDRCRTHRVQPGWHRGREKAPKADKQEARGAAGRAVPSKGETTKTATNEKVPPLEGAGEAETEEE